MNNTINRPEDLIPDSANYFEKDGIKIRKGTMASAVTNAEIVESTNSSIEEQTRAIETLKSIAPQLCAFGLNKHFIWRNPKIQAIFDEADNQE